MVPEEMYSTTTATATTITQQHPFDPSMTSYPLLHSSSPHYPPHLPTNAHPHSTSGQSYPPHPPAMLHGSPTSLYPPLPRRSSDLGIAAPDIHPNRRPVDDHREEVRVKVEDAARKRKKRSSMPVNSTTYPSGSPGLGDSVLGLDAGRARPLPQRSVTVDAPPSQGAAGSEDEDGVLGKGKTRPASNNGLPNLTSESLGHGS